MTERIIFDARWMSERPTQMPKATSVDKGVRRFVAEGRVSIATRLKRQRERLGVWGLAA